MILTRFIAQGLHGYLDFDIAFDGRLSFLTGINGSGKTSVINCIQALIAPDLMVLQSYTFEKISLSLKDDAEKTLSINATQSESSVEINASGVAQSFQYSRYVPDPSLPTFRQTDGEIEYYRDLMATNTNHPIMVFISGLPTPMFLGLDRRAKLALDDRRPSSIYRARVATTRRANRGFMGTSLYQAEDIAVDAYRDAQISASQVGEQLQRQLILNLLAPLENNSAITLPTDDDKDTLERIRRDLELFPSIFRLPAEEVNNRVEPFLKRMTDILARIPDDADFNSDITKEKLPEYFPSLVSWNSSKSQLTKIAVISQVVSSYNERRSKSLKPFEKYKSLVNGFLKDSGKSIDIAKDSRSVSVTIEGIKGVKPLSSLSSGEAQIFVILTNLAFSNETKAANVFIIDEPELSLHVRWQEMFVDSVLSANKNTQFVMATHSPSIILERTDSCVEVVAKRRRSGRA